MRTIIIEAKTDSGDRIDIIKRDVEMELNCCSTWFDCDTLKVYEKADTPQTDRPCDKCEWHKEYGRCIFEYCHYEYEQAHKDTPQTDCGWGEVSREE